MDGVIKENETVFEYMENLRKKSRKIRGSFGYGGKLIEM